MGGDDVCACGGANRSGVACFASVTLWGPVAVSLCAAQGNAAAATPKEASRMKASVRISSASFPRPRSAEDSPQAWLIAACPTLRLKHHDFQRFRGFLRAVARYHSERLTRPAGYHFRLGCLLLGAGLGLARSARYLLQAWPSFEPCSVVPC